MIVTSAKDLIDGLIKSEKLIETVTRHEDFTLIQKIRRWRQQKMFGSMAQLRSILLFKFKKSEEIFLRGNDHN